MKWIEMSEQERDRLVATTVMGWQERPCDLDETGGELTLYDSGDACCPRCGVYDHINSFEHGMLQPAHYTTNMDAAWQVLKAMASRYDAQAEFVNEPFAQFVDELLPNSGGEIWTAWKCMATEVAKWTPESICIAALKACGVVIEQSKE